MPIEGYLIISNRINNIFINGTNIDIIESNTPNFCIDFCFDSIEKAQRIHNLLKNKKNKIFNLEFNVLKNKSGIYKVIFVDLVDKRLITEWEEI